MKTVRRRSRKRKCTRKQFLYNPEDPTKSFDVYIDKNPSDTIPIRYTRIEDVRRTIQTLEQLYKAKTYTHTRISQVAMILRVRLRVLKALKPKQYALAKRYSEFLRTRTGLSEEDRHTAVFSI